jgi:hypothetical protein
VFRIPQFLSYYLAAADTLKTPLTSDKKMKCNIGNTDRVLRILIGLAICVVGLLKKRWWGLIGIIPLGTALARFCPLYVPLGVSTMKNKTDNHSASA